MLTHILRHCLTWRRSLLQNARLRINFWANFWLVTFLLFIICLFLKGQLLIVERSIVKTVDLGHTVMVQASRIPLFLLQENNYEVRADLPDDLTRPVYNRETIMASFERFITLVNRWHDNKSSWTRGHNDLGHEIGVDVRGCTFQIRQLLRSQGPIIKWLVENKCSSITEHQGDQHWNVHVNRLRRLHHHHCQWERESTVTGKHCCGAQ